MSSEDRPSEGLYTLAACSGAERAANGEKILQRGLQLLTESATDELVKQGAAFVLEAAKMEHVAAITMAATLAAAGIAQPADDDRALDHLEHAARLGSAAAQGQLLALADTTAQSAGPDGWKTLRESIDLRGWRLTPSRTAVCEAPRIRVVTNVAPPRVCQWLIARASGLTRPAQTFDPVSGAARQETGRTNTAAVFDLAHLDVVAVLLRGRLAQIAGTPVSALEPPQVLHYRIGQQFSPHYDFLDPQVTALSEEVARAGQRILTALVYLNDDYTGGETVFPHVGIRHRGRAGDGLIFANVDRDNVVDRLSLHAGETPLEGEKWVFSQWIRDRARV